MIWKIWVLQNEALPSQHYLDFITMQHRPMKTNVVSVY